MTEQFFEDLPRSERRAKDDEPATGNMNELVLPPAADMLSVDDLLINNAPAPAEAPVSASSTDMLADLPPMPTTADTHPQSAGDLPVDAVHLSVALPHSYAPTNEPAMDRHASVVGLEELSLVQADPERAVFSEALQPASPSSEAAPAEGRKTPVTFIEKHKPKLIIGVLVLAVVGWNQYKKHKAEETTAALTPVTQVAPYEAAIQHLQSGADNVSHLGASDPAAALDAAAAKSAGDDLFNGSSDDDKLFSPGVQPSDAKAPVIIPAAPPVVLPQPTVVAPKEAELPAESKPKTSVPNELNTVREQLAVVSKERDEWKQRALDAEKNQPKSKPSAPIKPAAAPVTKPRTIVEKPVHKVVSTKQAAPAAEPVKSDVQYLGSFLVRDNWHAHMIIGGNVYEVSTGQKIAGQSIGNVSANGAFVNGREYR
ncbi:hypothetical protein [Pseudomonas sp. GXZC]|uniref:hypothetical protein n=1 Tax=Pseudomonas sp. GXZC TaxID=3003351 RepID=UPI0022AA4F40|nr:hypothetical protein [Pseudomonas sp. GXZC]WAT32108.1 hypothetical protein OZ428_34165 [Pseudomonas sp. GXZC]